MSIAMCHLPLFKYLYVDLAGMECLNYNAQLLSQVERPGGHASYLKFFLYYYLWQLSVQLL